MNIFTLMTCWTCAGDCLAPDFWAALLILLALLIVTAMVWVLFNLFRWQLALTNFLGYHVNVFMFNLLRWQLALPDFFHVNNTFDWLFICAIKFWFGTGDFAWFSSKSGEQPNVVEHFIESSMGSYAYCVYESWKTCIIK